MRFQHLAASAFCAALASLSVTTLAARDASPARSMRLDSKKGPDRSDPNSPDRSDPNSRPSQRLGRTTEPTEAAGRGKDPNDLEILGTLVQLHTGEHVVLSDGEPTQARFDALLADRVTGEHHDLDPRLLDMLRRLAKLYPDARIELVSGFRSQKLNEMLRKKGHHVASHSQHSLGHAVDFRVVPMDEDHGISPIEIERVLREKLKWEGGVGVYLSDSDWFTHADVGPNRRWNGL